MLGDEPIILNQFEGASMQFHHFISKQIRTFTKNFEVFEIKMRFVDIFRRILR